MKTVKRNKWLEMLPPEPWQRDKDVQCKGARKSIRPATTSADTSVILQRFISGDRKLKVLKIAANILEDHEGQKISVLTISESRPETVRLALEMLVRGNMAKKIDMHDYHIFEKDRKNA